MVADDADPTLGVKQNIHIEMSRNPPEHIRVVLRYLLSMLLVWDVYDYFLFQRRSPRASQGPRLMLTVFLVFCFVTLDYYVTIDDSEDQEEIAGSYHFLRTLRRTCLAVINVWIWTKVIKIIYKFPYHGIGRNFFFIVQTLKDWAVGAYFCLMLAVSWTFALFYHIRFAERNNDGYHTFGKSFMVAFQYFMSYDQPTAFLNKSNVFDIFPTSIGFFFVISCVSLLFNNMATGLMVDVRNSRKKQWGDHHLNLQLSELAAIIEDCKLGAPYYLCFFRKLFSKNKKLGPFQTYTDQYYVLSWMNVPGAFLFSPPFYLF